MAISTPFRLATAAPYDAADEVTLNKLVDAGAVNLAANPIFLGWDASGRPQFWKYSGTVAKDATNVQTGDAAVSLAASAEIRQDYYGLLEEGIRSQKLSFRVSLRQAAVDDVEVTMDYGVSAETAITESTVSGNFVDLVGTVTVSATATKCELVITNAGSSAAQIDRVQVVSGESDRGWLVCSGANPGIVSEGRADDSSGSLVWEALPGPRLVINSNSHSGYSGGVDVVNNLWSGSSPDYFPTGVGYYNAGGGDEVLSFAEFDVPTSNGNAGKLSEIVVDLNTTGSWKTTIRLGAGFAWSSDTVVVTGLAFVWALGPDPPVRRSWPRA